MLCVCKKKLEIVWCEKRDLFCVCFTPC